jgi:hypothetical protein
MQSLSFIGRKTQDEPPHAVVVAHMPGGDWIYKILKRYSKDDTAPYARWLVSVESPMTFGLADMGDSYVVDVLHPRIRHTLVQVSGREPSADELAEFESLALAF